MKKTIILAQSILVFALFACQTPSTPTPDASPSAEASPSPTASASSGINVDANVGVNTGTGSTSGDANSALTVEANGMTYTRGQLKAYYECGANGDSPFKGVAAQMVTDIKAADSGNPAAEAIYVRAATNVANYNLPGCSI